ncbi:hypothetical protein CRU92_10970 [Arcobacter sp. FW59]|nr:hypothetical protein CRU92_10970 [Arcobacter sp. FW59]
MKKYNELVEFYNNKKEWTIEEIKEFEKKRIELYNEDSDKYDEISGFNDNGFGDWTLETRDCDSWGGLDGEIEKIYNVDTVDYLAEWDKVDFVKSVNDDFLAFNLKLFEKALDEKGYKLSYPDRRIVKK